MPKRTPQSTDAGAPRPLRKRSRRRGVSRQHGEPQAQPKGGGFRPPPAFVLAVGVALIVGGVAIARSGALNIRHVEVEGAQVVNARVIAEVSGLEGRSIVGTDLGRA